MNTFNLAIVIKEKQNWIDAYLFIAIAASIIGFLSLKSWTNTCLILILIPALAQIKTTYRHLEINTSHNQLYPIALALCLPTFAILFSQLLRQDWIVKAYDAPARILLSLPIFFYFIYKKIDYAKLISLFSPIAILMLIPIAHAYLSSINHWGNRFATSFVDPNAFGTYTLVLTAFCLFSLTPENIKSPRQILLCLGLFAGIYLLIGSQTRGSWLSIPPLLLLWIKLRLDNASKRIIFLGILPLSVLSVILSIYLFPEASARLISAFTEISSWLDNSETDTPTGVRLSMWKLTWELYKNSPFFGYGDGGYLKILDEPWLEGIATPYVRETIINGPHNELLANLLRSGTLGGISTLCLFLIPLHLFWQNRYDPQTKPACDLGIALITVLIFCSISIEVFTLKYTSSFYGLTIAGLAAQVIRAKHSTPPSADEEEKP